MWLYLQNILIKIIFFFISLYNSILEYFTNKGVKYIAVYRYEDSSCINVTNDFYIDTLIPKSQLPRGEYEVHYQINQFQYRQIFSKITPDEKLRNQIEIEKKDIKSINILSAFHQDTDILELIKQYAGPNSDFYGTNNLTLQHLKKQHNIDSIKIMDFSFEEYLLTNLEEKLSCKLKKN